MVKQHRAAGWHWVILAAVLGFSGSGIFSGLLQWPRAAFVALWGLAALGLMLAYLRLGGIDFVAQLRRRWLAGLIVGLLFGLLLARTVARQPAGAIPGGAGLVAALLGYGLAYGVVDALILNVLPVMALYGARPAVQRQSAGPRLRLALLALAGSLLVTAAYHLGFREFQGPALLQPLIGNAIITLSYLLSGSVLAPILAHTIMHLAAVLHGIGTTVQLPPHY